MIRDLMRMAERAWHGVPPEQKDQSTDKARDEVLNKGAKMRTATEGVFVQDLDEIGQMERDMVRTYQNKWAKDRGMEEPHKKQSEPTGNGELDELMGGRKMLVADNVSVTRIIRNGLGLLPALGMGGGAVAIGALLWSMLAPDDPAPKPDPPPVEKRADPSTSSIKLRKLSEFKDLLK